MCEIQNEHVFIFLVIRLFVIVGSGGWIVNVLAYHHEVEGVRFFPMFDGYHNFLIPIGFGFHKIDYRRFQFSLLNLKKTYTLG